MSTKAVIIAINQFISFAFLITFLGCTTQNDKQPKESQKANYSKPLPPPLPAKEQSICDSLKAKAYVEIRKGEVTIAFNDTITDIVRYKLFVFVLKNRLKFNYFRLDDMNNFLTLPQKNCSQPIMDSSIIALYGTNAKDSIIDLAYRMTDTVYKINKK